MLYLDKGDSMKDNFNQEERQLVKLIGFFKKKAVTLLADNKLGEEYRQMIETCDKMADQLQLHAKNREIVLAEREQLKQLVKDNAVCPKCSSNTQLKLVGTDKNEQGWRSNKYKCRRCNIEFVWNAPNNPWDMIPYAEKMVGEMEQKISSGNFSEEAVLHTQQTLENMKNNLQKLKPVVTAADLDFEELESREKEMADIVHKFKKHLMIEKIRMED